MQTFNEVVKGIRKSEKRVDKVLKAARLKRIESGKMSDDRFDRIMELVDSFLFGTGMIAVMAIFFFAITSVIR